MGVSTGQYELKGSDAQMRVLRKDGRIEIDEHTKEKIQTLVASRVEARKTKNWAEGDRIRDELAKMGIAIKDNRDGTTTWEVKR
jgi:cysteinyl-tRNA synthetase